MSDIPQDEIPKAKIISIKTRREVPNEELAEVEQELPDELKAPEPDADTVELVENFAEMVYDGRYSGALIVGWNAQDKCFFSDLVLPNDDHADLSACKLIGYLETVKAALLDIVQNEILVDME